MFRFINEDENSSLSVVSTGTRITIKFDYIEKKTGEKKNELLELSEFVDIMGWKAVGKKLPFQKISNIKIVEIIYEEETNGNDETNVEGNSEDLGISDATIEESFTEPIEIIELRGQDETNVGGNGEDSDKKEVSVEKIIDQPSKIIEPIEKKEEIIKAKPERKKRVIIPEAIEFSENIPTETTVEEFTEIEFGIKKQKKHHSKKGPKKGPEETQLSLF